MCVCVRAANQHCMRLYVLVQQNLQRALLKNFLKTKKIKRKNSHKLRARYFHFSAARWRRRRRRSRRFINLLAGQRQGQRHE